MKASEHWDRKALEERIAYRIKDQEIRRKECVAKASSRPAYEPFADEAAAELSVFEYLQGRPFLSSRDQFLSALDELVTFPHPSLAEFNQKRFEEYRVATIRRLRTEFSREEDRAPAP